MESEDSYGVLRTERTEYTDSSEGFSKTPAQQDWRASCQFLRRESHNVFHFGTIYVVFLTFNFSAQILVWARPRPDNIGVGSFQLFTAQVPST